MKISRDMKPVHMKYLALSLFVILLMSLPASGQNNEETLPGDYATHFDQYDVKGSMVIFDLKSDRTLYFDKERTQKRFSPASTFKIFNSLVGLETGVIPDTSYVIPWDSVKRGNYPPWHRSNSLKSAFRFSVVWYYQELARRVGPTEMQRLISANHYGNERIGDRIDGFWLPDYGGKLQISQMEQIQFLKKLYREELKFSKRSQRLVKGIMFQEKKEGYSIYAKTGMASADGIVFGWYVGWIELNESVYFFATYLESDDYKNILSGSRQGVTLAMLDGIGAIKD